MSKKWPSWNRRQEEPKISLVLFLAVLSFTVLSIYLIRLHIFS